MDKCPICGHVENTAQPVNSHVMAEFVRVKDGAIGIFNDARDKFTTLRDTGTKGDNGEAIMEKVEWVRKDKYAKPAVAAETKPPAPTPTKPATPAVAK